MKTAEAERSIRVLRHAIRKRCAKTTCIAVPCETKKYIRIRYPKGVKLQVMAIDTETKTSQKLDISSTVSDPTWRDVKFGEIDIEFTTDVQKQANEATIQEHLQRLKDAERQQRNSATSSLVLVPPTVIATTVTTTTRTDLTSTLLRPMLRGLARGFRALSRTDWTRNERLRYHAM
jgi:hypothetical protein